MRFADQVCLVTGGANGIGRCIAEAFIAEGARVTVIDKDEASGRQLAEKFGDKLLFMPGDISRQETLERFVAHVTQTWGSVNNLVNNACLTNRGILSGCSYEQFNEVLRVGVTAPYYLALLLKPHFAHGAAIVNIASTRALMSEQDTESYTAAKGGICALTHALCMSLVGHVRVNAISPGWIDTAATVHSKADEVQHPSGRVGKSVDIARMVLYLCSDDAGFINGENIVIDGGMTRRMIYHGDNGWTLDV